MLILFNTHVFEATYHTPGNKPENVEKLKTAPIEKIATCFLDHLVKFHRKQPDCLRKKQNLSNVWSFSLVRIFEQIKAAAKKARYDL